MESFTVCYYGERRLSPYGILLASMGVDEAITLWNLLRFAIGREEYHLMETVTVGYYGEKGLSPFRAY